MVEAVDQPSSSKTSRKQFLSKLFVYVGMKLITFLGSLLLMLFSYKLQAQSKLRGELFFNGGIVRCDHYAKMYDIGLSSDVKIVHEKQIGITTVNLNVIYFLNAVNYKLKPFVGVSFMPQGFVQKGYTSDSAINTPYTYAFKPSYISLFLGLRYSALESTQLKIDFAQLLLPMVSSQPFNNLKRIALSTRTEIFFHFKTKKGGQFTLSHFYQTSLVKFNTSKRNGIGTDYKPYSYGLNLGTYFYL